MVKDGTAGAPWYLAHPEQWVYPIQMLVGLAAVAFWWRRYTFRPLGSREILLAIVAGSVGIAAWLLPGWLFLHGHVPEVKWLGCLSREDGFDPTLWPEGGGAYWTAVLLRFVRAVICVAFVEELFWRGFLWRTLAEPYREFHEGPFGSPGWKPFWGTVLGVVIIHGTADYAGALVWGLLGAWLHLKTRSVGAAVIFHAVGNLLMCLYIMKTRQWGYW